MSDRVVKREKDKGKYNDIRSERESVFRCFTNLFLMPMNPKKITIAFCKFATFYISVFPCLGFPLIGLLGKGDCLSCCGACNH